VPVVTVVPPQDSDQMEDGQNQVPEQPPSPQPESNEVTDDQSEPGSHGAGSHVSRSNSTISTSPTGPKVLA